MTITVPTSDAPAAHFTSEAELARRAVEALALDAYRAGCLTRAELDAFLNARGIIEGITTDEFDRQMQDLNRIGL